MNRRPNKPIAKFSALRACVAYHDILMEHVMPSYMPSEFRFVVGRVMDPVDVLNRMCHIIDDHLYHTPGGKDIEP